MTKSLKKIASLFFILLALTNGFSQTDDKDVSITSSGSGKTLEQAKQFALRSAIEQAFGAFISSKTEMFNDQVVADQMSSVSSGNIKSFVLLNESQLPDSSWGVTLRALVSISKLTSFVEAKGIAIEIKGGMFALNIKQQLLNEQGEIKAVSEMVGLLHEPMQISFDYVIKSSDPKSLDAESKNWEIPLVVTATANKNIDFCANYCIKTLAALSLSSEEVTSYKSLNKAVFPFVINYKKVSKTFYLRKQSSINILNTLISQWEYYTRLFQVESGTDYRYGIIHDFSLSGDYNNNKNPYDHNYGGRTISTAINFLTTGEQAVTFSWRDKRTLSEIEQMTGYKVKSLGVISKFKHGGFVFNEYASYYRVGLTMDPDNKSVVLETVKDLPADKAGIIAGDKIISINDIQLNGNDITGLVNKSEKENKLCKFIIERSAGSYSINGGEISRFPNSSPTLLTLDIIPYLMPAGGHVVTICDLGEMDWYSAEKACNELIINGYSDWRLPSKAELDAIYKRSNTLQEKESNPLAFGLLSSYYWSSTLARRIDRRTYQELNRDEPVAEKMVAYWKLHLSDGRLKDYGVWGNGSWDLSRVRAVRAF